MQVVIGNRNISIYDKVNFQFLCPSHFASWYRVQFLSDIREEDSMEMRQNKFYNIVPSCLNRTQNNCLPVDPA